MLELVPPPAIEELAHEASTRAAIQATSPAAVRWKTPTERALELGMRGIQIPTHIETMNKACRGGPRTSHLVVFGGAPGSGKTTLAVDFGVRCARAGIHVGILAADESADGLLIRIGQLLGFRRDDLEPTDAKDPAVIDAFASTRVALAERLTDIPTLMLVDAEEERCSVEDLSAELRRRRGEGPSLLILDSIQRVFSSVPGSDNSMRARVDANVLAAQRAQKIDAHLVVATCELSRAAYRGGKEEAIDDLAAFAESRAVEYSATTAFVMRSVVEQDWLVDVTMPKNRNGTKKPFRLRLDPWRAAMSEVGIERPEEVDEDDTHAAAHEALCGRIVKALKRSPLPSANAIVARVRGKKTSILAAVKELETTGQIAKVGDVYRVVARSSDADS